MECKSRLKSSRSQVTVKAQTKEKLENYHDGESGRLQDGPDEDRLQTWRIVG